MDVKENVIVGGEHKHSYQHWMFCFLLLCFLPVMNKKFEGFIYNYLFCISVNKLSIFSVCIAIRAILCWQSTLGSKGHQRSLWNSKISPTSQLQIPCIYLEFHHHLFWTWVFLSVFQIQMTFWAQDLKLHPKWKLLNWWFVDSFQILW